MFHRRREEGKGSRETTYPCVKPDELSTSRHNPLRGPSIWQVGYSLFCNFLTSKSSHSVRSVRSTVDQTASLPFFPKLPRLGGPFSEFFWCKVERKYCILVGYGPPIMVSLGMIPRFIGIEISILGEDVNCRLYGCRDVVSVEYVACLGNRAVNWRVWLRVGCSMGPERLPQMPW